MKKKILILSASSILFLKPAFALVSLYGGAGLTGSLNSGIAKDNNISVNLNTGLEFNLAVIKVGLEGFYEKDFSFGSPFNLAGGNIKLIFNSPIIRGYLFGGTGKILKTKDSFAQGGIGLDIGIFGVKAYLEVSYLKSKQNIKKTNLTIGARYYFF
jgi:hypothetical protein